MPSKATLVLPLLVLTAQMALAAPPACLLAAVNEQTDPSNMNAVCAGSSATDVTSYICKNCDKQIQAALDEFEAACLGAGLDISAEDACSTKSQSSSILHTATQSSTGTSTTDGADSTASASQSAGNAEGSNAAVDAGVGSGGVTAALLFAALVAL